MRAYLLVLSSLPLAAASARADVVWRGDFESGDLSQWSSAQVVSADRLQVVTDPVRQGSYALRVEVRQGDDPINASGNRAELVKSPPEVAGTERYYAWSTLWPLDYPSEATWQLFTQWHHSGNTGSPPVEFYVNGETVYLRLHADNVVWSTPLERGVWHDFIFHVVWSPDPAVSFVELWYDGAKVLETSYPTMFYNDAGNYLKMGLYRNDTIVPVGVLYHDAMVAATSFADVAPPPADAGVATDAAAADGGTDDGSAGADAPPAGDGAVPPAPDARAANDAPTEAAADGGASLGGGCACRAANRRGCAPGAPLILGLALLGWTRRQRARR